MEENVFYKPGEPSSVMSLNEEVDLFASCVNIYTTETDVYGDIMDEPRELEVFDEGAWAFNLATGIVATLGLAACAVAVVATGGAALAVVAFASAAVGTGVMTAGMSYADKKNQKNRSNLEYGIGLMLGAAVGALTGVGIMYAGPALTVAGEQAGFEASFLMGTNALTVSTIPDIVTAGGMTLLATDGAYVLNEINTMCTGQNLAVDTVFEGNEENYEACVVALQVLNDGLLDLTTRGYQRSGSGSSSSEAEKSDEGAEISESGVNIRGAGDEGRISAKGLIGHDFEDYLSKTIGGEGSFSVGGRDFDGGIGNRWWEAKSGNYWSMLEENPNKLAKFKSDMGDRLRIATENGATYEIFSNTPIPESIKQWLTKKGIAFTELLD
ncbi:MAG: hypothetical protein BHV88_23980 [Clostridiales bacterium 41_12_two_minus]|jgi:hypothetical protein|nr:MAG: hypothetical protein BHV88_23980 [Clostridiales bacterium 41_12_two_minus]